MVVLLHFLCLTRKSASKNRGGHLDTLMRVFLFIAHFIYIKNEGEVMMNKKFMAVLIFSLILLFISIPVLAEEPERIYGIDRYETAVEISKKGWENATTVVITTAWNFPDALAGAPLAYQHDAPILLTNDDSLPSSTINEINRLGASKAFILGGTAAVSNDVKVELESIGLDVQRIFGANRSETAIHINNELEGSNKAIIVDGNNYPDALAVAPYAARNGIPIYLTERGELTPETLDAIQGVNQTYIIGGVNAVSNEVVAQSPNSTRVSGNNRFDTVAQIVAEFNLDVSTSYFATGNNFADALTGSVLAAKNNGAILLVNNDDPEQIEPFLSSVENAFILGGTGAVNQDVFDQIKGDPADDTKTVQEIFALNNEKTVIVSRNDGGHGSGVIVSGGLILTNEHVIDGARQLEIILSDGNVKSVEGVVISDENKDLALVKTDETLNIDPVVINDSYDAVVGDDVVAIGSPSGFQNTLSNGIISGIRTKDSTKLIQTTATISFGNSGGGLFDQYGELIGINTWVYGDEGNLNFAVDISEFEEWEHYLSMKHDDIFVEEQPTPIPTSISLGMTRDEVKAYESNFSTTLTQENDQFLVYNNAILYGLETTRWYAFENDTLFQYEYHLNGANNMSWDELEDTFYYFVINIEDEYGVVDYIDNNWYNDSTDYILEAIWIDNNQRPFEILLESRIFENDFTARIVIVLY